MTVKGIICLLLDIALLILGLGSGIRALLIGAFFLLLVWVASLLALLLAVPSLRVESALEPAQLTRGTPVHYRFIMQGRVPLPVAGHVVIRPAGTARKDKKRRQHYAFFMQPSLHRWERTFEVELPCDHRGYWPMAPESLRLQDVFGLFSLPVIRRGRVQPLPVTLCVLPKVHPLPPRDEERSRSEGFAATTTRNAVNGELFGDTRQYQPGDPVKRVHWKQTARTGQLYIRQFEAQENPQTVLLLDLGCRSRDTVRLADIAAELAATIARYTLQQGKSLQVLPVRAADKAAADREDSWLRDERDMDAFLLRLAGMTFHTDSQPLDAWQLQDTRYMGAGTIRVITEDPSKALLEKLQELKNNGHHVTCLIPAAGELSETVMAALDEPDCRPIVVADPDQIAERVGDCL